MAPRIQFDREAIEDFCRRHHITKLSFFGSVLREDFGPGSDIDVLVEFHPDHIPGLAFFSMQDELSTILGRRVDLHTPGEFGPRLKQIVMTEAELQYVAA